MKTGLTKNTRGHQNYSEQNKEQQCNNEERLLFQSVPGNSETDGPHVGLMLQLVPQIFNQHWVLVIKQRTGQDKQFCTHRVHILVKQTFSSGSTYSISTPTIRSLASTKMYHSGLIMLLLLPFHYLKLNPNQVTAVSIFTVFPIYSFTIELSGEF